MTHRAFLLLLLLPACGSPPSNPDGAASLDLARPDSAQSGADLGSSGSTTCGGDPTGKWTITGGTQQASALGCDADSVDLSGLTVVDEYGGFNLWSETVSGSYVVHYPPSCFQGMLRCSYLSGGGSVCTDQGAQGCACVLSYATPRTVTGSWALVGGKLVITSRGQPTPPLDYCVEGDTLRVDYQGRVIVGTRQ